jgi:DNA invertase Pin-like site-specific DNA recombinase
MIGYIGKSRHMTDDQQRAAIDAHADVIIEHDIDDAVRMVRPGSALAVARLVCLAPNRDEIAATVQRVAKHGGKVFDVSTETLCCHDTVRTWHLAAQQISRRSVTSAQAQRNGKQGGRPRIERNVDDLRKVWQSEVTAREAAEITGVSTATLYNMFGKRGRKAGRPKIKTT